MEVLLSEPVCFDYDSDLKSFVIVCCLIVWMRVIKHLIAFGVGASFNSSLALYFKVVTRGVIHSPEHDFPKSGSPLV